MRANASRLERLHAWAGVLPLGALLALELWVAAHALYGREAFEWALVTLGRIPSPGPLTVALVLAPFALSVALGPFVRRGDRAREAAPAGPYHRWLSWLLEVSGPATLAFLAVHLWHVRPSGLPGARPWTALHHTLSDNLSEPRWFAVYFLGATAAVFHLSVSVWRALSQRGLAPRRAATLCGAAGLALWFAAVDPLLHFAWRCGGALPLPGQDRLLVCEQPDLAGPYDEAATSPNGPLP